MPTFAKNRYESMQPTISIITVSYNCKNLIEGTLKSVFNQHYPAIEYLVIDGKSTDGTTTIIDKYKSKIDYYLSEPDKGLYDAMNKGLKHATGEFVWFLNAGDHIPSPTTLETIFQKFDGNSDIIYGKVMMVNEDRSRIGLRSEITTQKLPHNLNFNSLKYGMVVSHQGFFPKLSIVKPYIENNLAADIDWVLHCLKHSKSNQFIDEIFAEFVIGGTSKQRHKQSLKDRFQVLKNNYGVIPNLIHHLFIIWRAIVFKISRIGKASY